MLIRIEPDTTLETYRCFDCGRHWALDTFAPPGAACPCCAGKSLVLMREQLRKLERQVAALRGVISRKKSR